jgi:hypothetical protein
LTANFITSIRAIKFTITEVMFFYASTIATSPVLVRIACFSVWSRAKEEERIAEEQEDSKSRKRELVGGTEMK